VLDQNFCHADHVALLLDLLIAILRPQKDRYVVAFRSGPSYATPSVFGDRWDGGLLGRS